MSCSTVPYLHNWVFVFAEAHEEDGDAITRVCRSPAAHPGGRVSLHEAGLQHQASQGMRQLILQILSGMRYAKAYFAKIT